MSDIFCIAPFVNLCTTSDGRSRLCCQAKENHDFYINNKSVDEVFNSLYFKEARQKFIENKWPNACESCRVSEEKGISTRRSLENTRWQHLDWEQLKNNPKIHCFDLRLGNQCNLSCVMCSPRNSVAWYDEYKNYEHINSWKPEGGLRWARQGTLIEDIRNNLDSVQMLYFSGGEPLLNKKHFEIINLCIEKNLASNIDLVYDTNGTAVTQEVINKWNCFKNVQINFSIDGVGSINEYIRYPIKWNDVVSKFELLQGSKVKVYLQFALGAHNLLDYHNVEDLIDYYNFERVNVSIVHWPTFMSVDNLHDNVKQYAKVKYNMTKTHRTRKIVRALEYTGAEPIELQQYFTKLDKARNLDHTKLFPWLYGKL